MAAEDDWLLRFLSEFAAMPETERDSALDALPAERRAALVALADIRARTASADLLAVLDAGHLGLEKLYQVTDPADLYAVINLALGEEPHLLVEALFAALVVHRGWEHGEPEPIADLRDRWVWHVHENIPSEGDADG
ncbi:MAG TPA: hypothetical protein VHT27_06330 [Solirubrobacteraceae bacterium]|jgi:hypothetical protein|nr:hypothetical protein [Solirubrobacteraceae bacterium]